jgi:hypothetical protein
MLCGRGAIIAGPQAEAIHSQVHDAILDRRGGQGRLAITNAL